LQRNWLRERLATLHATPFWNPLPLDHGAQTRVDAAGLKTLDRQHEAGHEDRLRAVGTKSNPPSEWENAPMWRVYQPALLSEPRRVVATGAAISEELATRAGED
jgi:hypothetical protein